MGFAIPSSDIIGSHWRQEVLKTVKRQLWIFVHSSLWFISPLAPLQVSQRRHFQTKKRTSSQILRTWSCWAPSKVHWEKSFHLFLHFLSCLKFVSRFSISVTWKFIVGPFRKFRTDSNFTRILSISRLTVVWILEFENDERVIETSFEIIFTDFYSKLLFPEPPLL